ncbi:pteridine reductase [Arenicella xantha]|uniref:Pteridine reductase n=1 Tax=Arenicella xantha TaxID=644221 RepID=A0A395JFM2_9GAMM|nr:pteridine reductase [Arenicella xantha]RBP47076.1 pteridine reductase [Arenicella xantha]
MNSSPKTILITGGARRIGRQIALTMHEVGHNIAIHYRSSSSEAHSLATQLNDQRPDSAIAVQGDLLDLSCIPGMIKQCLDQFGRLDVVVNNASTFYPTPIELIEDDFWKDLIGSNLKAPAFIAKAAVKHLRETNGSIINLVDIHARHPMAHHPIYCSAKAGLEMLTKSLARDLAPNIRVNAVAPGAILWPEHTAVAATQTEVLEKIPLQRMGKPEDVAKLVRFLVDDADYITGQIIAVDGGRSVMF